MTSRTITCLALLSSLVLVPACGDDDGNAGAADAHVHDHDDAATTRLVNLDFAGVVGSEAFACSEAGTPKVYAGLGTSNSTVGFKDFRLYVSNIRLLSGATEVPVTLDTDGKWQLQGDPDHVALLDFEDGTGLCSGTGNSETNTRITGTAPIGSYDGVVFDIGVPFSMNHLDVTTADPPLNIGPTASTSAPIPATAKCPALSATRCPSASAIRAT